MTHGQIAKPPCWWGIFGERAPHINAVTLNSLEKVHFLFSALISWIHDPFKLTYPHITAALVDKRQGLALNYSGATFRFESCLSRRRSSLMKQRQNKQTERVTFIFSMSLFSLVSWCYGYVWISKARKEDNSKISAKEKSPLALLATVSTDSKTTVSTF